MSMVLIWGTQLQWSWWLAVAWSCVCCFIPRSEGSKPHKLLSWVSRNNFFCNLDFWGEYSGIYSSRSSKHKSRIRMPCCSVFQLHGIKVYQDGEVYITSSRWCVYRWLSWSRVEKTFLWPALTASRTSTWWQTTGWTNRSDSTAWLSVRDWPTLWIWNGYECLINRKYRYSCFKLQQMCLKLQMLIFLHLIQLSGFLHC